MLNFFKAFIQPVVKAVQTIVKTVQTWIQPVPGSTESSQQPAGTPPPAQLNPGAIITPEERERLRRQQVEAARQRKLARMEAEFERSIARQDYLYTESDGERALKMKQAELDNPVFRNMVVMMNHEPRLVTGILDANRNLYESWSALFAAFDPKSEESKEALRQWEAFFQRSPDDEGGVSSFGRDEAITVLAMLNNDSVDPRWITLSTDQLQYMAAVQISKSDLTRINVRDYLGDSAGNIGVSVPGLFFTYWNGTIAPAPVLSDTAPSVDDFMSSMPYIVDQKMYTATGCPPGVVNKDCADYSRQGDAQRSVWAYRTLLDVSQEIGYVPGYQQILAATWITEAGISWDKKAYTNITINDPNTGKPLTGLRPWSPNPRWEGGELLFGEALARQMAAYATEVGNYTGRSSLTEFSDLDLMVILREYAAWPGVQQSLLVRKINELSDGTVITDSAIRKANQTISWSEEWIAGGEPPNTPYLYGDPVYDKDGNLIGELINPTVTRHRFTDPNELSDQ